MPAYHDTAEHFDEWKERALDLYHGHRGQDSLQVSTELALRGGLRDVAYEAAHKILHKDLMTLDANNKPVVKGLENLIETARQALQQEAPIRVSETSELIF